MTHNGDPEKYREYMREYMLRRYHKRRAKVVEQLGGACVQCGSTEDIQIDHRRADSKAFDVAKRLGSAPWTAIQSELGKCRLLCEPCHQIKTARVDRGYNVNAEHLLEHEAKVSEQSEAA